jgi:hypothetical protein
MKEKTLLIIIGIIILAIILYNQNLFTILTPDTPDNSLDKIVNKLYFPIASSNTNKESCSYPGLLLGSSFNFDITSLPSGTSNCMRINQKNYKPTKTSTTLTGTCSLEGEQVLFNNKVPLSNFIIIKKGSNFIVCQNLKGNKYKYTVFSESTGSCSIKYTLPLIEPEGKYYCDKSSKKIYFLSCGGKTKTLVESCSLGCEQTSVTLDDKTKTEVVKCIGDYQPNKKVCSEAGDKLYSTSKNGSLTSQSCCSCSGTTCKTTGCKAPTKKCTLIGGDGKGQINIIFYNDANYKDYVKWAMNEIQTTEAPFNEFTYNFYEEANKYDCKGTIKEESHDTRIGWEEMGHIGYGLSGSIGVAGNLMLSPSRYASVRQHFLFFHELGHVYTHRGHSGNPTDCDGSIMNSNGGDSKFKPYHIVIMRKNLNSTKVFYDNSYGMC